MIKTHVPEFHQLFPNTFSSELFYNSYGTSMQTVIISVFFPCSLWLSRAHLLMLSTLANRGLARFSWIALNFCRGRIFTQSSLHSPSCLPNHVDPNHWPKIQFNTSVQLAVPELLCNLNITNYLLIPQLIIHGDFSFYYHVLLSNFLSGFIHSIVNIVTVVAATSSFFFSFFSLVWIK